MENLIELKRIIAEKDARIAELERKQSELEKLVIYMSEQMRLSKLRQFAPTSEKAVWPEQIGLFNEAEGMADPGEPEPEIQKITYCRRKHAGKRETDLEGLPVETVEHKLPEEERFCSECGGELHEMGHDIRRELKIVPAQVLVVEHKRAVYSCRNCENNNDHVPMVKAPMPEALISGSLASPSAVAHIISQKFVMHTPLYRQEKDLKRQGVALSRQTMANWIIRCAQDWLMPLYKRLLLLLLAHTVLHADETVVQVLNEPGRPATTNSYMWLYRTSGDTDRHIILFEYQPTRSGEHPRRFLSDFKGILHADGYAAYHTLPDVTVVGCWVHMRRKFADALKVLPADGRPDSIAQDAIMRIGRLFHLEDQWAELRPEERYARRLEESKPLAEDFFAWLETLDVLPKSALGRAIRYALDQRPWLMNVYLDGRAELSNNRIENSVRPFALGRKNWLFCNTVNGATASSIIYSIIETAAANGLKPFEYLKFLFETVPNTATSGLDALLPWGDAVPERCKMPLKEIGTRNEEKPRRGTLGRLRSVITVSGA